jgi:hypothetical protein
MHAPQSQELQTLRQKYSTDGSDGSAGGPGMEGVGVCEEPHALELSGGEGIGNGGEQGERVRGGGEEGGGGGGWRKVGGGGERGGGRKTEIVVIGVGLEEAGVVELLDSALMTPAEIARCGIECVLI